MNRQEKSGDAYKKEEEMIQKISQLNEEVIHFKKKVQEQKRKEEEL